MNLAIWVIAVCILNWSWDHLTYPAQVTNVVTLMFSGAVCLYRDLDSFFK